MNVVYEEFTEKFRIVGNLYKCICYLEKNRAKFEIHIVTEKQL